MIARPQARVCATPSAATTTARSTGYLVTPRSGACAAAEAQEEGHELCDDESLAHRPGGCRRMYRVDAPAIVTAGLAKDVEAVNNRRW